MSVTSKNIGIDVFSESFITTDSIRTRYSWRVWQRCIYSDRLRNTLCVI